MSSSRDLPFGLRRAGLAFAGLLLLAYEAGRPRLAPLALALSGSEDEARGVGTGGVEIERKFLVDQVPADLHLVPCEQIDQGYLALDGPVELRLRRRGARPPTMTVKAGRGKARTEDELPLPEERFAALWPFTEGRRLRKLRYVLDRGGGPPVELDVYLGWLRGLMTAEVEFASIEACAAYRPPAWLGGEITGDPNYRNQALAQRERRARAEREFRLRCGEGVADGIRRIAVGQIDEVLERLDGRIDEDPGTAVHEARKSLKRLRAVARLVRDELGEDAYRRDSACFRAAGRTLSASRDSEMLVRTLDALVERYPVEARAIRLGGFRARLTSAQEAARAQRGSRDPASTDIAAALSAARDRVAAWPLPGAGAGALAAGLRRGHRRARRAHAVALLRPEPELLHEWRKRTKDLWYAAQILEVGDPRRLKPFARRAHDLSELLGDDHDLVVLEQRLEAAGTEFPDPDSAALLRGLCERRRAELELAALGRAAELHDGAPSWGRVRRGLGVRAR